MKLAIVAGVKAFVKQVKDNYRDYIVNQYNKIKDAEKKPSK